jgi:sugar/nucleoside kinase (ribokinase family)
MIGVGGIGSGSFFAVRGNQTLGREESRGGHFLDRRDYCKLHIVSHYVRALLGPSFTTIPVGKIGEDEVGRRLLREMDAAGLDTRYVECSPGNQTLFSFCLVYPDGSGGNLTTDDSACAHVDGAFVTRSEQEFHRHRAHGIALAVPEVPIEARAALLTLGAACGFFRVAAFTSQEMRDTIRSGLIRQVQLLAITKDEAAAAVDLSAGEVSGREIVPPAVDRLHRENPAMWLSITAGKEGSWTWDGDALHHVPALNAPVSSTAGAGDAHLSGVIAGITAGLALPDAQQLGTLVAAFSVTSPHTIHPGVSRESLGEFARQSNAHLSASVSALLEDDSGASGAG